MLIAKIEREMKKGNNQHNRIGWRHMYTLLQFNAGNNFAINQLWNHCVNKGYFDSLWLSKQCLKSCAWKNPRLWNGKYKWNVFFSLIAKSSAFSVTVTKRLWASQQNIDCLWFLNPLTGKANRRKWRIGRDIKIKGSLSYLLPFPPRVQNNDNQFGIDLVAIVHEWMIFTP